MSTQPILADHGGVFGISHLDVPVADLERAARFYLAALGFTRRQAGTGWIDLDASSISIRLLEVPSNERRASLRVQVAHPEAVLRSIVAAKGRSVYEPMRTPDQELVASARDLDGNTITVWRALTEDEYGYVPELPIDCEWSPEAVALMKSLLLAVPAIFRGLARRKVVRVVEELVPRQRIAERDVVRGYILASARVTRDRLRAPLARHGFDPEDFRTEFESE